jgi:hypothetical protein
MGLTSWIEFRTTGDDNTATKKTDVNKDCVIRKKIEALEKKMAAVKKAVAARPAKKKKTACCSCNCEK